jgi:hypothetical protein
MLNQCARARTHTRTHTHTHTHTHTIYTYIHIYTHRTYIHAHIHTHHEEDDHRERVEDAEPVYLVLKKVLIKVALEAVRKGLRCIEPLDLCVV